MNACICSLGIALSSHPGQVQQHLHVNIRYVKYWHRNSVTPTMSAMPDVEETRELASLLVALVGQTAAQISQCAEQCGLSMVQASALLQIDGGMSMRDLAARLGGHASNATGIADRLAARGLVERREDAEDRRVKRVDLTAEGAATRAQLVACMESTRPPFARLSDVQRRQLRDLLLAAIEPKTDLNQAQRQAARILGSIELD
jgi:MarR family transcriptional regulator, organic hydroperoxide resistance regulator